MSGQVIASPETMRDFARNLDSSNHQLVDVMNHLSSRLSSLGDTWHDDHYAQFDDAFRQAATWVNRFVDQSERYIRYLHQKAGHLESYQEVHLP